LITDIEAAESRKQLLLVKRKLDFYSGWILSYAESGIPQVVPELLIEKGCSIMFICGLYCDWKYILIYNFFPNLLCNKIY